MQQLSLLKRASSLLDVELKAVLLEECELELAQTQA